MRKPVAVDVTTATGMHIVTASSEFCMPIERPIPTVVATGINLLMLQSKERCNKLENRLCQVPREKAPL